MNRIFILILFLAISLNSFANGTYIQHVADTSKPLSAELRQSKDSNALVVVDGKVIGAAKDIKSFDSLVIVDSIKKVNVLKDNAAVSKYGEKGRFGVIEIYLKDIEISEIEKDDKIIFEKTEIEASFPGGVQAWRRHLEGTLSAAIPSDNGAPNGIYTVIVQFIVHKDGSISDVKVLKGVSGGPGCDKEATRVVKMMPKWNVAKQNGKPVRVRYSVPINFRLG